MKKRKRGNELERKKKGEWVEKRNKVHDCGQIYVSVLFKVKTALVRVRGHSVFPVSYGNRPTVTRLQSTKTQFSFLPEGKIRIPQS